MRLKVNTGIGHCLDLPAGASVLRSGKWIIETKFQELKSQETNNPDPLFVSENLRSLRNRNAIIYSQDTQSKFLINTFSYFSHTHTALVTR